METSAKKTNAKVPELSLTKVISTAMRVPGVKVDRSVFLCEQFKEESSEKVDEILAQGPVQAGCSRSVLHKKALKLVNNSTLVSTGASFIAGIPGGFAMAATIPADMMQFYAIALRLAQEIAYLYGEKDLCESGVPEDEHVMNQLVLYCGVMLGATGAAQAVRFLSANLAKQILKKLPQKALTKTFLYPIVKSIVKFFGFTMTKSVFAKGISKAVPLIGGVVSGGITFASMRPMGMRLVDTLDKAHFEYTEEDAEADFIVIEKVSNAEENEAAPEENAETAMQETVEEEIPAEEPLTDETIIEANVGEEQSEETTPEATIPIQSSATAPETVSTANILDRIQQAKQMQEAGIITEEDFIKIKNNLLAQMK